MSNFFFSKPQKTHSQGLQASLSGAIARLGFGAVVGGAVNFDGEHEGFAVEVNDELVDGSLAIEVVAHHLFAFEVLPKLALAWGHVVAKLAGAFFKFGVVGDDGVFHGWRMCVGDGVRVPTHPWLLAPLLRGVGGVSVLRGSASSPPLAPPRSSPPLAPPRSSPPLAPPRSSPPLAPPRRGTRVRLRLPLRLPLRLRLPS